MPTLSQVTEAHARQQKLIGQRTALRLAGLWAQLDLTRIASSWRQLVPQAVMILGTSQATAAASAGAYVEDALEAQAMITGAEGRVAIGGLAGAASDGRDLAGLLYQPAIRTLENIQRGLPVTRAKAAGLMSLDTIVRTQVADAGRNAESIAIVARPSVKGYVRMLSLPSCSRCIILAGRVYRWNQGFKRHPRCDCRHIPTAENTADDLRTDPKQLVEEMSPAERERVFGKGGAAAIEAGADLNRVVNADRGVYLAGGKQLTREAAGRRPRLTPDQILKEAQGSRDEAIRLLRLHGYLT